MVHIIHRALCKRIVYPERIYLIAKKLYTHRIFSGDGIYVNIAAAEAYLPRRLAYVNPLIARHNKLRYHIPGFYGLPRLIAVQAVFDYLRGHGALHQRLYACHHRHGLAGGKCRQHRYPSFFYAVTGGKALAGQRYLPGREVGAGYIVAGDIVMQLYRRHLVWRNQQYRPAC